MCCYQTLFHDAEEGYVVLCRQCKHIQVGFGNVALTLSQEGFLSLQRYLLDCERVVSGDGRIRNVRIPTPCDGIHLLLSSDELKTLLRMFDQAETEWRSQTFLEMFQ